jgi:hypothetical protein
MSSTDTTPPCRRDALDGLAHGYDASVLAEAWRILNGYQASVPASEQRLFAEGPA